MWLLVVVLVVSWLAPITECIAAYLSYIMYLDIQETELRNYGFAPYGAEGQSLLGGGGVVGHGVGGPV